MPDAFGDVPPQLMALWATPRDDAPDLVEVYPEHWTALSVFLAMQTQWRVGFGGETGLDYSALPMVYDCMGIEPGEKSAVFDALRQLEIETLTVWAKEKKDG